MAIFHASFAICEDLGTQLRYIILLVDNTKRVSWLSYASYKCRRVVHSVLSGEIYAMADFFDAAFLITHNLENVTGLRILFTLLTDSESLFISMVTSTITTEKG